MADEDLGDVDRRHLRAALSQQPRVGALAAPDV
jgi:hypothetical protein